MATLTIEVPDDLAVCDFLALDRTASAELLREAIYGLGAKLEGISAELQAIYDTSDHRGASEQLRALAIKLEGEDLVRRIRAIADGLDAF